MAALRGNFGDDQENQTNEMTGITPPLARLKCIPCGNKTLKRTMYTSCTSLLLGDNPYHDYYNKQRAKGKNHGRRSRLLRRSASRSSTR